MTMTITSSIRHIFNVIQGNESVTLSNEEKLAVLQHIFLFAQILIYTGIVIFQIFKILWVPYPFMFIR
uniref:Uncharacterized protein n=1 Tax=Strongyloides venezuelensis TaxID=75913 RepID=A0A0K0FMG0_STRVS